MRAAGLEVGQHLGPEVLCLARDDRVRVLEGLLGREGHPGAAEHHALSACAEVIGEVIGAADLRAHRREADDVGRALDRGEVEVGHELVGEGDLVRRRGEGLQVGEGDAARPVARRLVESAVRPVVRGRDQVDAHRARG